MYFLIGLALLVAVVGVGWTLVGRLDSERKRDLKDSVNRVFDWAEARDIFPRLPAFVRDYHDDYPGLRELERNHAAVKAECLELLGLKDRITDIEALGGNYTQGGIHSIKWKSYMFKSGQFLEENCARAPQTTALLRRIPGLYTAFLSILEPHQYVTPHFGYYKGFVRYHLGVVLPKNNADESCWLRVNADLEDNRLREKSLIDKGERYHWHEGEGVVFDDTNLHDAANDSDEVRVVLWLDLRRKMPFYIQWFNRICLFIAHRDSSVRDIREGAVVR